MRLFQLLVAGALGLLALHPAAGQTTGTIRGAVTDGVTGAPVVGAKVAAPGSGRAGRVLTDSAGRYVLDRVRSGTWTVVFNCPSRTLLGRKLVERQVAVAAAGEAIVNVVVPPDGCFEPDSASRSGEFRGHYAFGFEESRFVPCLDSALGPEGVLLPGEHLVEPSAWVEFSKTAQRQPLKWPGLGDHHYYARYYVAWRGTLIGPGMYGHMGVSSFAFVVDSVLEVRLPSRDDCQ